MEFLTRFGIEKSRLTILAIIGLMVVGSLTYISLPKREDPAVTIRSAVVSAIFSGMKPERVEDLIAKPLERKAREIGEIEDISTLVTTGQAVVTLDIYNWVPEEELVNVFQDIRNKMQEVNDLPDGTKGPFVNTDYGDVAIATIAVTGEGFNYREIWEAADDLRADLYKVDGITKVSIDGEQEERIWLEINSRKLAAVGVQLPTVLQDLEAQNVILPAGEIDAAGTDIVLEANGNLDSIEEIKEVLTQIEGTNDFVRLGDLFTVRRGYVDPPKEPVYFNGKKAMIVSVEMAASRDVQQIGSILETEIRRSENKQPIGITFNISTFQADSVKIAVDNALSNVGQTFFVVFIVMLVFLGWRSAFVIASIVPLTAMFALICMRSIGIDIEQISIAAVIISLGLLVDNGLVVVEEIEKKIESGIDPTAASIAAGGQFFIPLAVSSITTVSAFIPMLILDGTEGEYAFSLGAVVGVMLMGSWITAHYILPYLCTIMLKPSKRTEPPKDSTLMRLYGSVLSKSVRWGFVIIVICYGLVVAAVNIFGLVRSELFPLAERSEFIVYMDMPKGTAISETTRQALQVNDWLLDEEANPEVANTTIFVGSGGPRFYLALDPADTDPASAFFLINTKDFAGAQVASERARRHFISDFPGARFRVTRLAMGGQESGIVDVEVSGPGLEELLQTGRKVEKLFSDVPDIQYYASDWGNKRIKIVLDVAQDKARQLGVSSEDISSVLETFFRGSTYSTFREGEEQIPIVARAGTAFRDSIEDIRNVSISANGQLISLDQVVTFEPQIEYSQIRRENQERHIVISGKGSNLPANKLLEQIQPGLDKIQAELGPEYKINIGGEIEQSGDVNTKLSAGMPAALIVMLIALVFQFNSVRKVGLVFMTIPLIIVGAPLALYLTDQPLSFFAILGLISLMGIIINNAIVLIDQIDIQRQSSNLIDAIITGSKKRVTPVLLTTLTTSLGLVPMAIAGGALFEPMATLMIGGLVLASTMSLFFVPSVYYLMYRRSAAKEEAEQAS